MIRDLAAHRQLSRRKPRASGDDPYDDYIMKKTGK